MADESRDPTYLTIYHSDHDGEPLALIRTDLPGNHATEIAKALRMLGNGRVEVVPTDSAAMSRSQDMADLFAVPETAPGVVAPNPDEPGSTADPDATLRAEIRAQLEMDERRKRVEGEVRKEMAEDRKAERAKD